MNNNKSFTIENKLIMQDYSQNLVIYRKMLGISQTEMAKKLGYSSQQAYQRFEKMLSFKMALKFGNLLDYDLTKNINDGEENKRDEIIEIQNKQIFFLVSEIAKLDAKINNKPYELSMAQVYERMQKASM